MAKLGDSAQTSYGRGTITEIDTVRGRSQFRVAGRGFNVWLDETKIHVAAGDNLFSFAPMMEEAEKARHAPQYSQGYGGDQDDPDLVHFSGLETTIDPGTGYVNDDNHADLPYDYTPQYPTEMFADESTIQPGEYPIDAEERLHPRPSGPQPSRDLFAAHGDYAGNDDDPGGPSGDERCKQCGGLNGRHAHYCDIGGDSAYRNAGNDHGGYEWAEGFTPDEDDIAARGRLKDPHSGELNPGESWGNGFPLGPGYERPGFGPGDVNEYEQYLDHHGYDKGPYNHGDAQTWKSSAHRLYAEEGGIEQFGGEAPATTMGELAVKAFAQPWTDEGAARTSDSDTTPFNPGPKKIGYYDEDQDEAWYPGGTSDDFNGGGQADPRYRDHPDSWDHQPTQKDYDEWDARHPELVQEEKARREREGSYRPAGLSDRYAYFDIEANNGDDPISQFRRDPVGYINLVGHLWTDGDDSLEKFADYSQLIDVDPRMREAAWNEVRQKAMRLRHEGKVHVNDMDEGRIYATVEGDHGTYDTMIAKGGSMGGFGGGQSITNWNCSCDWGRWAFKRQFTYVGRLCSHAYAAYLDMQSQAMKDNPGHFRSKQYSPYGKTASVVDDYAEWLEANNKEPSHATISTFSHNPDGAPLSGEDVQELYDYVRENAVEPEERDYGHEDEDDDHLLHTTPGNLVPSLHLVPVKDEKDRREWTDVTKDDRETTGPDQIVKKAQYLATLRALHGGEGITDFASSSEIGGYTPAPGGDPSLGTGAEAPGAAPTGGDGLMNTASRRYADDAGTDAGAPYVDPTSVGGFQPNSDPGQRPPSNSVGPGGTPHTPETPPPGQAPPTIQPNFQVGPPVWGSPEQAASRIPDLVNSIPGMGLINSIPGAGLVKGLFHGGSLRFAESSDESLLDKLREFSTTPASDDLGHMDEHNDELRDLVDELNDRGYDASYMVAAVNPDGDFRNRSRPEWNDQGFSGSGPDPKDWYSTSEQYVDEHERPNFEDLEGDGTIVYNDDKPEQGPKKTATGITYDRGRGNPGAGHPGYAEYMTNRAEHPKYPGEWEDTVQEDWDAQYPGEMMHTDYSPMYARPDIGLAPGIKADDVPPIGGYYPEWDSKKRPEGVSKAEFDRRMIIPNDAIKEWSPDRDERGGEPASAAYPAHPKKIWEVPKEEYAKYSGRYADNFNPASGSAVTPPAASTPPESGMLGDAPNESFNSAQTTAALHMALDDSQSGYFGGGGATGEDWENASGEPFMNEVQKATGEVQDNLAPASGDGGGEEAPEGEDSGGGMDMGDAAAMAGAAAKLAPLLLAGRGPRSRVRIDPGARQPQRPRVAYTDDDYENDILLNDAREMHKKYPLDGYDKEVAMRENNKKFREEHPGLGGFPWSDPPHRPHESDNGDNDIVAAFQRSAGAASVMGNGSFGGGDDDIAARAQAFLRTAGRKYSPDEQRELESEFHPLGARNRPTDEELAGTHYVQGL